MKQILLKSVPYWTAVWLIKMCIRDRDCSMEWLKKLLETAEIKDGKLDVDSLLKSINAEFPKHAVPKVDYNTKAEELRTATETIETLKKENKENGTLQQKIKDYEADVKRLQGENETVKKTYALKEVLQKSGCADPDRCV